VPHSPNLVPWDSIPHGTIVKRPLKGHQKRSHFGIKQPDGRVGHYNGEAKKASNAVVAIVTLDEFLDGQETCFVFRFPQNQQHADAICQEVLRQIALGDRNGWDGRYSLLGRNCEHWAKYSSGYSRSSQKPVRDTMDDPHAAWVDQVSRAMAEAAVKAGMGLAVRAATPWLLTTTGLGCLEVGGVALVTLTGPIGWGALGLFGLATLFGLLGGDDQVG